MLQREEIVEFVTNPELIVRVLSANRLADVAPVHTVRFGPARAQYVLLFEPSPDAPPRRSVVAFWHGGGWRLGSPGLFRCIGRFFASLGFTTLLGGYRLTPRWKYPAQLEDARQGLIAGLAAVGELNLPADRLLLGGQSSGAQLAALLVHSPNGADLLPPDVQINGLFLISGPLNFSVSGQSTYIRDMLRNYAGPKHQWPQADPIRHVQAGRGVPVLCVQGEQDPHVFPENSISYIETIRRYNAGPANLICVPWGLHSNVVTIFLDPSPEAQRFVAWLAAHDK